MSSNIQFVTLSTASSLQDNANKTQLTGLSKQVRYMTIDSSKSTFMFMKLFNMNDSQIIRIRCKHFLVICVPDDRRHYLEIT